MFSIHKRKGSIEKYLIGIISLGFGNKCDLFVSWMYNANKNNFMRH